MASPRGQWRTGKKGENGLQNHLWCPNDPCGKVIDDDDGDNDDDDDDGDDDSDDDGDGDDGSVGDDD